jgi:hypothetical protein
VRGCRDRRFRPRPRLAPLGLALGVVLGAAAASGAELPTAPDPAPAAIADSSPDEAPPPPQPATQSPRNANYTIEVRLDVENRTLEGRETVTWRNLQDHPADELWFHLYWNGWRNERSTWMLEDELRGRSHRDREKVREGDWSYVVVDSIRPSAGTRFAAPDDGNPDDRTVFVVTLPAPVEPGASIDVELAWHAKIPRTFARTGFRGNFFFVAQWFPKLGVFEPTGWNCHQYHASTEYFSDYGVYNVELTVPGRFVVGASGREMEQRENPDGTVTHVYREADIHDFAWTASPEYVERRERFDVAGLPPVDIRLLLQPEHVGQAARHMAATKAALELYGRWSGPYPYPQVTVIDPAFETDAGGMEYPTLFTAGTRLFSPLGSGSPEHVTIHEAGHQFWYALVGNNEFEAAWLDEGINTFLTGRAYQEAFGDTYRTERYFVPPETKLRGFFPLLFRDLPESWKVPASRLDRYRGSARSDVPATASWRFHPKHGGNLTYSKTALWLMTLERTVGWPTLQRTLATLFERYRFHHPRPEDFFSVASEVSGQDLSWFFDQVQGSTAVFDYAIEKATSRKVPSRGLFEEGGGLAYRDEEGDLYRSEVVVRRMEDGVFPVDILLVFEDGSETRQRWDGQDTWRLVVEERASRLDYAIVDPDRVLMLDVDYTNNSYQLKDSSLFPAVKWAATWLVWMQDLLSTFAWFS